MNTTEPILARALKAHGGRWWAKSPEEQELKRLALNRLARQSTAPSIIEDLIVNGQFADAESLLLGQLDPALGIDERERLGHLLADRRREAIASIRAALRQLRLRSDRLGDRRWDDELATLIEEEAALDLSAARGMVASLIEAPICDAESRLADALRARAAGLAHRQEIEDCIAHRMWSLADRMIDYPGDDHDGHPLPPLAILGVSPAWAIRQARMRSVPPASKGTWRELDLETVELVEVVGARDDPAALARVAGALGLDFDEDGTTIVISGFALGEDPTSALASFDTILVDATSLTTERLLRVALSRGNRRPQLLRALLHNRPMADIYDTLLDAEPDLQTRVRLCLQLASATTGDDVADAVCHEAGHHPDLAQVLLESVQARANVDRHLTVLDVEQCRLAASTIERYDAVLAQVGSAQPLALRALSAAAELLADRVDDDIIQLLVDDAPVQAVKASLLASGLARPAPDGGLILGIEPLHLSGAATAPRPSPCS